MLFKVSDKSFLIAFKVCLRRYSKIAPEFSGKKTDSTAVFRNPREARVPDRLSLVDDGVG